MSFDINTNSRNTPDASSESFSEHPSSRIGGLKKMIQKINGTSRDEKKVGDEKSHTSDEKSKMGDGKSQEEKFYERAMSFALAAVGRRRLTEHQLREKLQKRYIGGKPIPLPEDVIRACIERVVTRMREFHYIDDHEYAEIFIRDTLQYRPHGSMWITMQLRRKGIESDVIAQSLEKSREGSSENLEYQAALTAAGKKIKTLERVEPKKRYEKLFRFICGRGFAASVAFRVLDELHLGRSGKWEEEM